MLKVNPMLKQNLASTLKAMAIDESLTVDFVPLAVNNFFKFDQNSIANKNLDLHENNDSNTSLTPYRALIDLAASYKLFHNFNEVLNLPDYEQDFVNNFERIRVLSLLKDQYFGAAQNILLKISQDLDSCEGDYSLILLKEVFSTNISQEIDQKIQELESNLPEKIIQRIKGLNLKLEKQNSFTKEVLEILRDLSEFKKSQEKESQDEELEQNQDEQKQEDNNFLETISSKSVQENADDSNVKQQPQELSESRKIDFGSFELPESFEKSSSNSGFGFSGEFGEEIIKYKNLYKIYNAKYDEIIHPQKFIKQSELETLRDNLDLKILELDKISKQISLKLKRKLLSKKHETNQDNNNAGILNRKKLTRLVIDPTYENIWQQNQNTTFSNTALTILLDNSGSMRGRPIVMAALACEILAEILEKFQIKTEIIGFTTKDWRGGRVRKEWEIAGKPKNPGRLNELRHIIYKGFNESFKKAKSNLGLMLKEGILKENIDGEAILFAKSRLQKQEEQRKILMVISDGNPIDDSTNLANDEDILSNHLKHVVNKTQKEKKIEIVAIGIGHVVESFYQNSITIKDLNDLGDVMIEKICDLL